MPNPKLNGVLASPITSTIEVLRKTRHPLVTLSGYLGFEDIPAPTKANPRATKRLWKLYRTLDHDEYVLIEDEDEIRHIENATKAAPAPGTSIPLEEQKVVLWFLAGADLKVVADFVAGELTERYLPHVDLTAGLSELSDAVFGHRKGGGTLAPPCKI